MKRICYTFAVLFLLTACNNSRENNENKDDTPALNIDSTAVEPSTEENTVFPAKIVEDVILFPATYRILNSTELKDALAAKQWKEIYKIDGKYTVANAVYSVSKINEDPCSGLPAQEIMSNNKALLLFSIDAIQAGMLDTVAFEKAIVDPKEPLNFVFNNQKFKLEAEGISFYSDNGSNPKGHYTLKLYSDKYPNGMTILHQSDYNDTSTEIVMIGDFDKDGLPDLILSSPRDYEEERYLIILSSDNTTYEGNRQFDC